MTTPGDAPQVPLRSAAMGDGGDGGGGGGNSDYGRQREQLDQAPSITVLGTVDKGVAIRLNWRKGIVTVSIGRLKFLRDELGFVVRDDPSQYIL